MSEAKMFDKCVFEWNIDRHREVITIIIITSWCEKLGIRPSGKAILWTN